MQWRPAAAVRYLRYRALSPSDRRVSVAVDYPSRPLRHASGLYKKLTFASLAILNLCRRIRDSLFRDREIDGGLFVCSESPG